jgi:hypothetical protein
MSSSGFTHTLKLVKESLPLVSALGVIVGSSVVALYSAQIGFFPSGVTAGDTFIFLCIFVAAAFFCVALTLAFYTQIALFSELVRPVMNYLSQKFARANSIFIPVKATPEDHQFAFVGAMIAVWMLSALLWPNRHMLKGGDLYTALNIVVVIAILHTGIRSRKANVSDPNLLKKNIRFAEVGMWLMVWCLPAAAVIFSTSMHELMLSVLKVRLSNVSVVIEGNGRETIWNAIDTKNCRQDPLTIVCSGVSVPLHGIGSQVFVRIPSKEPGKTIVFAIPKEKVVLFH